MYGKLFSSCFTGSMFGSGPTVFAVWAYVIANVVESQVELNPRLLAAALGTTVEDVDQAIAVLCAPDALSRSKIEEGRRLIREGQYAFRVPNHEHYRRIQNEDDRREYNRRKQAEHRAKKKGASTSGVNDSQSQSAKSRHTEADVKEKTDTKRGKDLSKERSSASKADAARKRTWLTPVSEVWHEKFGPDTFPFKQHAKALAELYRRGEAPAEVARRLKHYLAATGAQYVSVPKFVQTYGEWDSPQTNGSHKGNITEGREQLAAWMEKE
jgi:hypothetical protein